MLAPSDNSIVRYFLPLFVIGFLAVHWVTLKDYGLTWDSALGEIYLGDKYFHYFKQ